MSKKMNWYCLVKGKEVGPVGSGQIKQWLTDSTLNLTDKIRREDSEWKEISTFPKLVELVEPAKPESISGGGWRSKAASVDKFVFGEDVSSKYPEWVPDSLVSYSNYMRWVIYLVVCFSIPFAVMAVLAGPKRDVDFSTIGKIGILPMLIMGFGFVFIRSHLLKLQNRLLNGDRGVYVGVSLLAGIFGVLLSFGGLASVFATKPAAPRYITIPLGIGLFIWTIASFVPWGYFAVKYRKHFERKELDAEAKKMEAEGRAVLTFIFVFVGFLSFGIGGLVAYTEGQVLIGIAVHLAYIVLFGPWIYRTVKGSDRFKSKVLNAEKNKSAVDPTVPDAD